MKCDYFTTLSHQFCQFVSVVFSSPTELWRGYRLAICDCTVSGRWCLQPGALWDRPKPNQAHIPLVRGVTRGMIGSLIPLAGYPAQSVAVIGLPFSRLVLTKPPPYQRVPLSHTRRGASFSIQQEFSPLKTGRLLLLPWEFGGSGKQDN